MTTQALIISCIAILGFSVPFSMIGQGGGAAYVPILLIAGMGMLESSTYSLLLILVTCTTATIVFSRGLTIDWTLLLVISPLGLLGAFAGGFVAKWVGTLVLTIAFALMLFVTAFFMMRPAKEGHNSNMPHWLCWERDYAGQKYQMALGVLVPAAALAGFVAGLLGVGAGLFLLSMLVLWFRCPMRIAIGLSVVYVGVTALPSFIGRLVGGSSLEMKVALPLSLAALCGAIIGPLISRRATIKHLRSILAGILLMFAVWMVVKLVL